MYRRVRLLTLLQIGSMNPDVVDLRAKGTLECPLLRGLPRNRPVRPRQE